MHILSEGGDDIVTWGCYIVRTDYVDWEASNSSIATCGRYTIEGDLVVGHFLIRNVVIPLFRRSLATLDVLRQLDPSPQDKQRHGMRSALEPPFETESHMMT